MENNYNCIQKKEIRNKYSSLFYQQKTDCSEWNNYNTRELALQIGKEANLVGIEAMILTAIQLSQNQSAQNNQPVVFSSDIDADGIEIALSGAWQFAVMGNKLTAKLSASTLANTACVGCQIIKNLFYFANGRIDSRKTLAYSANAMTAAIYGLCWNDKTMSSELSLLPQLTSVTGYIVGNIMSYAVGERLFVAASEMADIGVAIVKDKFIEIGANYYFN